MTRIPTGQIRIDPYFDGEGTPVELPPHQRPATLPGHEGYQAVDQVRLADGRPMAVAMREGPEGLRGTVIPRATMGGIPMGTRPHSTANLEVHVDPHIDGQSTHVRLGDLTPESIRQAEARAREITPDPTDIATLRLRGAAIMHGVAAQARQAAGPAPRQYEGVVPPGNIPAPHLANYGTQTRRVSSPLQAFSQPPPDHDPNSGRPLRAIDMSASPTVERAAPPPQIQVTFEIERFGTHTAVYHDVLIYDGFIVLVYNTRYTGSKYFPPAAQDAPPMALNVAGRDEVYLVHATGFMYPYAENEFCVLMVERVGSMTAQQTMEAQE